MAGALVPALDLRSVSNDRAPNAPGWDAEHLPQNIEAEQALLGVLIYDNAAYERIGDHLKPGHFLNPSMGASSRRSRPRCAKVSWSIPS